MKYQYHDDHDIDTRNNYYNIMLNIKFNMIINTNTVIAIGIGISIWICISVSVSVSI